MEKPPRFRPITETTEKFWGKIRLVYKKLVAAVAVLIIIVAIVFNISNTGYTVYINEKPAGTVKDDDMAREALAEISEEIILEYGRDDLIIEAEMHLEKVKLSEHNPVDKDQLKQNIRSCLDLKRQAVSICVDGKEIVSLAGRGTANTILEQVKERFTAKKEGVMIENVTFKEKVEVLDDATDLDSVMEPDDALRYITNGTTETKTYTVTKGDSLWLISKNNNISVEDLEKANPGVDPKKLQIGQQLSMIVPKPFITVVTEEICSIKENIPFETEYYNSSEFYKGESIVRVAGKYGQREITARIIRENGIEVSRDVLDERIIKEPVTKQVAVGTKPPPPRQGTGTFSYPARGTITSKFGWRWGRRHNGIDIGLPVGTPVKAADGGTVKFSGKYGGFGNLVIIDHGDGYESYYGHNEKNLVSKGDKVHKGQTIALSGNTGNSTGPHLHFEVRRFGAPVNPLNYLKD
jgi:murein DD-endopeptidase MepM/ murein hydrolase activator NlpD